MSWMKMSQNKLTRGKSAQLFHHDLETSDELELLRHDVDHAGLLPPAGSAGDAANTTNVVFIALIIRSLEAFLGLLGLGVVLVIRVWWVVAPLKLELVVIFGTDRLRPVQFESW